MAGISALGIGSGLDLNGLLDQLEGAERQKLVPIVQQKGSYQAKISAYGKLEGALSQFQVAAERLNDRDLYQSVTSKVNGTGITAAAGVEAAVGRYQVEVVQLAQASSVATMGVADKNAELGAGTLTFTFGNNETLAVEIAQGDSSLESIRDAINSKNAGVSASIINDGSGSPHRLVFSSTATGTDAAIENIDFGGVVLTQDDETKLAAQNAQIKVNGINIDSQSNRIEGAIQGVALDITETGTSSLSVERDNGTIKKAITGFVEAYNGLKGTMSELSSYGGVPGSAGALLGDNTLRGIESQLRSALGGGVSGGEFSMLRDIGISMELGGKLKLDDAKLDDVLANNLHDVADFFAADSKNAGMAGQLSQTLERMLDDRGALSNATTGLNKSIERLDQRFERMERSIDATIARYRAQFAQMDSLIAGMNSTSSYLTQQFDAMNAQLGRK